MALYYLYGLFPALKDHGSNCNSSGFLFKLFGFHLMNGYRNLDCCPFPTLYKKRTQNRVYNQSSKSPFACMSRLHRLILTHNDSYRFSSGVLAERFVQIWSDMKFGTDSVHLTCFLAPSSGQIPCFCALTC